MVVTPGRGDIPCVKKSCVVGRTLVSITYVKSTPFLKMQMVTGGASELHLNYQIKGHTSEF
jgi:hypothetical protein